MSVTGLFKNESFVKEIQEFKLTPDILNSMKALDNITLNKYGGIHSLKEEDSMLEFEETVRNYPSTFGRLFHKYAFLRVIKELNERNSFDEYLNNRLFKYPLFCCSESFTNKIDFHQNIIRQFVMGSLPQDNDSMLLLYKSLCFFSIMEDYIKYNYQTTEIEFSQDNFLKGFSEFVENTSLKDFIKISEFFERNFIERYKIKEARSVVIAPKFGHSSKLIGGAEADLYIDGILYEFKTSSKRDMNPNDFLQAYCYYVLDEISKDTWKYYIDSIPLFDEIEKIAVYYARYGGSVIIDINKLPKKDEMFAKVKELLVSKKETLYNIYTKDYDDDNCDIFYGSETSNILFSGIPENRYKIFLENRDIFNHNGYSALCKASKNTSAQDSYLILESALKKIYTDDKDSIVIDKILEMGKENQIERVVLDEQNSFDIDPSTEAKENKKDPFDEIIINENYKLRTRQGKKEKGKGSKNKFSRVDMKEISNSEKENIKLEKELLTEENRLLGKENNDLSDKELIIEVSVSELAKMIDIGKIRIKKDEEYSAELSSTVIKFLKRLDRRRLSQKM